MSSKAQIQADIAAKKERLRILKARRNERGRRNKPKPIPKEKPQQNPVHQEVNTNDLVADLIKEVKPEPTLSIATPEDCTINIDRKVPEVDEQCIECAIIGDTDEEKKTAELSTELQKQQLQLMVDEENMRILKEQLKKDKLRYEKLKEEERLYEPQELSGLEIKRIESSKEFQHFFTNASKVVERALNFTYDITIDYDEGGESEEKKEAQLKFHCQLLDDKRTGCRAITSISWSSKFKELLLTSYNGQENSMSLDPDGTVLIWNMHMPNRPEYYFYCNSAVLIAEFHPSNPKLIVGGCRSGQVVVWDTRLKRSPVQRTSLSRGHTYPIYALKCLPIVNNNNLISVSTDGRLCQWNDSDFHEPTNEIDLAGTLKEADGKGSSPTDEITTTSFDFPGRETSSVILGSDEGKVYKARIYDKKGIWYVIDAHDAPITNVQFHPTQKNSPSNVSDLFLTSSYDWTVKLWSNKTNRPLYTFESARDYVFDVQWSTQHPAVFASGDGTGKLDVWNLTVDTEKPTYSVQVEKDKGAISRVKWSEDGSNLAAGMSTGAVHVFRVKEELYNASNEASNIFYSKMNAETINV